MNESEMLRILDGNKYHQRNIKLLKWSKETSNDQFAKDFDGSLYQMKGEERLKITYVLEQVEICGSTKILLQQANELIQRGHQVTVICQQYPPQWISLQAQYRQVPWQMDVSQAISDCDIIICSGASSVIDCYLAKKAPVIHFEQGEIYIFEFDKVVQESKHLLRKLWSMPVARLAVSRGLAEVIEKNFKRRPQIIHNALDTDYFYPPKEKKVTGITPRILLVGPEQSHFKGISDILKALELVRQSGRSFDTVWVTPKQPNQVVQAQVIMKPSQSELGEIYRSSDIYICGSYYESFPLPPLEAMTSGCAVISTENVGVLEYAVDGYNCLLTKIGDPQGIAHALIDLLDHPEKRAKLVQGGYATAQRFSWSEIIPELEGYMYSQVHAWRNHKKPYNLFHKKENILRIEVLPQDLEVEEVLENINQKQKFLHEDWCLWLVEGEYIENSALDQIKRILAEEPLDTAYSLGVRYEGELPDIKIVRWESRILKKGVSVSKSLPFGTKLPIQISKGIAPYFLPSWLAQVRRLLQQNQAEEAVFTICEALNAVSAKEQIVMKKWLIIALTKLELYKPAILLIGEVLGTDYFYSDVTYLFGKIGTSIYGHNSISEYIMQKARIIGDAWLYPEYFEITKNRT